MKGKILKMRETDPELADLLTVVEDEAELKRLKVPTAAGAILQKRAASLHPYKLVMHLWRGLIEGSRVNVQTNTPVTRLSKPTDDAGGKWLVHTDRGDVRAEHVLLATNAYTAHLVEDFEGLIVPVQGQMSALRATENALVSPLRHDYGFRGVMEQDEEEDDYLVQRPVGTTGGEFMFGGGRMVSKGAGVGVSDDGFVDGRVRDYLRRMLPKFMDVHGWYGGDGGEKGNKKGEGEVKKMEKLPERYAIIEGESASRDLTPLAEWTGIMGYSRDGHPWVGGVPNKEGLWVCAGYTGHGMPNTSLCGRHVAGLIDAAIKGEDWREVERTSVREGAIPECFVVSAERMEAARRLPEVGGRVAE
jgi:glycine/D-amino acid oxidase-like deaminating enzyme